MIAAIAFRIIELALSLAKGPDAAIAATLLQIIQSARQAYEDHTGQPLDLALIKPEEPQL
jgi:hypothetical protein